MAALPRGVPANWEALDHLANLGNRAGREVAYATPREILQRLGGPDATGVNTEEQTVWWNYWRRSSDGTTEAYVNLYFVRGRVVRVSAGRND